MNNIIIRNALIDDEDYVNALCLRNNLQGEISSNSWNWIWLNNQFFSKDWPIGWILEDQGNIVGFIGNIPRGYSLKGNSYRASIARAFVVDKDYRKHSLKLISQFIQQKNTDVLIFSSANRLSSSIYKLIKANPLPQIDYERDLFWVVSPSKFLYSILRKRLHSKTLSLIISNLLSPFLVLESLIKNRWGEIDSEHVRKFTPDSLPNDLDIFWNDLKLNNPNKFLSIRDKEALMWQFNNESAKKRESILFAHYQDSKLFGYMVISKLKSSDFGFNKIVINDVFVKDNEPIIILSLLKEVFLYAKKQETTLLQCIGFPVEVRNALKIAKPFSRRYSYNRFWYYVINPELKEPLRKKSTWYASMFDGDSSI
jgi:hypothetical protein